LSECEANESLKDEKVVPASTISEHPIPVQVEKDQVTEISWIFRTVDYDISFGVVWQPLGERDRIVVVETALVPSHQVAVKGSYKVATGGNLIFIWDNYASWTTAKTVNYSIATRSVFEAPAAEMQALAVE